MEPRRVGLIACAAVGGSLLAIVVVLFWQNPGDDLAYWLAAQRLIGGQPVYTTGEAAFAPYAFHYPPPAVQLLAPLTIVIPTLGYLVAYRALELLTLWTLAGRRFVSTLALIAFLPVAVELTFENVHLFMALVIVVGLSRWPWLFSLGAIVKVSPGLGIVYLAVQRRWREVALSAVVGVAVVGISYALDRALWDAFLGAAAGRADVVGNSLVAVPYSARALAGLAITVVAGLLGRRRGELLLVIAVTVANPNLALNGFAVLAALVPVWRAGPAGLAGAAVRGERAIALRGEAVGARA